MCCKMPSQKATNKCKQGRRPPSRPRYGTWSQENLEAAIGELEGGKIGLNETACTYNIPKATLKRYMQLKSNSPDGLLTKKIGRKTELTAEIEDNLVQHIMVMALDFL